MEAGIYGTNLYDGPPGTLIGSFGNGVVWEITR